MPQVRNPCQSKSGAMPLRVMSPCLLTISSRAKMSLRGGLPPGGSLTLGDGISRRLLGGLDRRRSLRCSGNTTFAFAVNGSLNLILSGRTCGMNSCTHKSFGTTPMPECQRTETQVPAPFGALGDGGERHDVNPDWLQRGLDLCCEGRPPVLDAKRKTLYQPNTRGCLNTPTSCLTQDNGAKYLTHCSWKHTINLLFTFSDILFGL